MDRGSGPPDASPPAARPWRLLLVHAHPDDESILTGATMARAAAAGHHVSLLTATRGEAGEVYPSGLSHLAGNPAALAAVRETELIAATALLGVRESRFLCPPAGYGARRWVDSGMAGAPAQQRRADELPFATSDLSATAAAVAEVICELRPDVLVTYDEHGGYGHPDHIAAHRATMAGAALAAGPEHGDAWQVRKIYEVVSPRSVVLAGLARAAVAVGAARAPGLLAHPDPGTAAAVDDEVVTTAVDGTDWLALKASAMAAHHTQLEVVCVPDGPLFALTNRIAAPVEPIEYYRLVSGTAQPDDTGVETDLFAGLNNA